MTDVAMLTNSGGRDNNEDYIMRAEHGDQLCLILCDGLGGHACGEVASALVANSVAEMFRERGYDASFLADAFEKAQRDLLAEQNNRDLQNSMKSTMVVLVITPDLIQWAHIGDSRLYRIYDDGEKYQRTRDHSLVQVLCDTGEIKESEIRTHTDRNKLLRALGAEWRTGRTYDVSPVLERGEKQAFLLMTDGFWEYVCEQEMLGEFRWADSAQTWLNRLEAYVRERADMTRTDNYSAIAAIVSN